MHFGVWSIVCADSRYFDWVILFRHDFLLAVARRC